MDPVKNPKPPYSGPKLSFTVAEFCAASSLSRSKFYELLKSGDGPRLMKVGRRTLVSAQAASDWQRQIESASSK